MAICLSISTAKDLRLPRRPIGLLAVTVHLVRVMKKNNGKLRTGEASKNGASFYVEPILPGCFAPY